METYYPFTSLGLEKQMLFFSPEEQRLVREVAEASKTQAQHLIDEIKKRNHGKDTQN